MLIVIFAFIISYKQTELENIKNQIAKVENKTAQTQNLCEALKNKLYTDVCHGHEVQKNWNDTTSNTECNY